MKLNTKQNELCQKNPYDFSDLKALFINCTLKKSPEISHTDGLIAVSKAIMEKIMSKPKKYERLITISLRASIPI